MLRQGLGIGIVGLVGWGLLGCGQGSLAPVAGKVTYKGQPVASATVTFIPAQGTPATGVTDAGGHFTLNTGGQRGAAPGKYEVTVIKAAQQGPKAEMKPEDMKKMYMEAKGKPEAPKSEIPVKYANPKASGLGAEVTTSASKNNFDFDLTD